MTAKTRQGCSGPWVARIGIAVLCLVVMPRLAVAQSTVEVGYVESFDGFSEEYVILRGGESLPIGYFTPIHQGDVIVLEAMEGFVHLRLGPDNDAVLVPYEEIPFTVDSDRTVPTPIDNGVRQFAEWLTGQQDLQEATGVTMSGGGSLELRLPGLIDRRAQIASGNRPIGLTWGGGTPPFTLLIADAAGTTLVKTTVEDDATSRIRHFVSDGGIPLAEGTYTIVIEDSGGSVAEGGFRAVAAESVPVPPTDLSLSALSADASTTIAAAWLSGQDRGLWALEALQRCLPLVDRDQAARALCRALAKGQVPPP